MSKLIIECDENTPISILSYNIGKLIEGIIEEETNDLKDRNILLESKILSFYWEIPEPFRTKYANHFGIKMATEGRIESKWKCIESCMHRDIVPVHLRTSCTNCYSYRLDLRNGK